MEFEDQITYVVVHGGFTFEQVLDMDVISFGLLTESLLRVRNADKYEGAWTQMIAAQGAQKDLKKWAKQWKDNNPGMPKQNDQAKFIGKYGAGV